jgi:hypothetical protein
MSEARIGRIVVASLHQAIADIEPMRLDFYENWLSSSGLRHGTIGLAPMSGVLGFLRREETYDLITQRAGQYAAAWTISNLPATRKLTLRIAPDRWRTWSALRLARQIIRDTYPTTRPVVANRRGSATIEIRGSLFCEVRGPTEYPLCGFYAAAVSRVFELLQVPAETEISGCRAVGRKSCLLTVVVQKPA